MDIWKQYHSAFGGLEESGRLRRPKIPDDCEHNAHMYYLLLKNQHDRVAFIDAMKHQGIHCVFHYVPLHTAPQGRVSGRVSGELPVTDEISDRLVRVPLWIGLEDVQGMLIEQALSYLNSHPG